MLLERGYDADPEVLALRGEEEQAFLRTKAELCFRRDDPELRQLVDLQWKLSPGDWIDPALLWKHAETVRIDGVELRTVQAEAEIAYLSFHGAKHLWGQLRWIVDLAALLDGVGAADLDIDRLFTIARARIPDGERKISLALDLASSLVGDDRRRQLLSSSRRDRATRSAARQVSTWLFARGDDRVPAHMSGVPTSRKTRFFWTFPRGPVAKARYYGRVLGNLVRPNQRDVATVRLPHALRALYVPVRIARIARQEAVKRLATGRHGST